MKKHLLPLLFLLLLTASQRVVGQTQTIFDFGTTWKYLDNGSNQGTTWYGASFSDASWVSGTGYFGYGDTWINTCVNACGTTSCAPACTNKYITTYFRKTVTIADTNLFDSIKLGMYRDDGAVVYVNGVEVWRDNMPTGTIAYNTLANSPAIGGTDETTPVFKTIPISFFLPGDNVIAVELHQQAANSSDLTFNMQASGVIRTRMFGYGSSWKYLTTSTDQGTGWRASTFSDAAWPAGTGHIGFGESWTNTCIPAGPSGCTAGCTPGSCTKYTTTYFRKAFTIPDLSLYDSMRFSVFRDDGIVVYVNGTEVWRDNMPTGTISYSSMAPNNINGTTGVYAESLAVVKSIPISSFATGSNTIAIELHQNSATSSDLDFNVQLTGVRHIVTPVTLAQGPYLNMGSQTAVNVRWRTNVASKSRVELGTAAGTYTLTVNDAAIVSEHEVRVTGLTPDTKYYYRFGTDTSIIQGDTTNFFVTAPADTSNRRITIAAFGDCGRNDNSFQTGSLTAYQNYLAANNMKAADLMLLMGDNAYDAGTDAEFSNNFFNRYSGNVLKNHMLFPSPGNHDYANSSARQADHNVPYYNLFSLPTAGECGGVASGTEAYYSYNWGNIHFLSLDSYGQENAGTTRMYDTTGAQVTWIKNDLAANTKKWTIAYWHHPPFTKGSHNSDSETELINIRQNFIRILERYGVDMIICGHSHDYERSYLLKNYYGTEASFNKAAHTADSSSAKYNGSNNSCPYMTQSGQFNHGTVYVVSGSAGADGGVQSGYPHDALPYSIDDGGMFFIDVQDNRLDARFLRRDNTVGDKFTIMKDVKVRDTLSVLYGNTVELSATWVGAYAWAPGITTRAISVTAVNDTLITVKDSLTNTCINDQHYIDVQCTMPAFTSCPGNIHRSGCDATVTYSVADTARPAPALTYAFTGATTGSGLGSGSGATFSVGVTSVTVTATNSCGSATCNFTITVDPLPVVYNVTGGGGYCAGASGVAIGLDGSENGVDYQLYDGATAIGSVVSGTGSAISFGDITALSTYSVLATQVATSCTSNMAGSKTVSLNSNPAAYTVTGGGNYCSGGTGVAIGLANSEAGVDYQLYNGSTAVGSSVSGTGTAIGFGQLTIATTYTVAAVNSSTGCHTDMTGSASVTIDPLPNVFGVTGGGGYCIGGAGSPVGLINSESGINYQLYDGAAPIGSPFSGTGSAISFGNYTMATTYTVQATNATTGCIENMTGDAIVSINPLPDVYTVSGGGNYCAGGSGVPVGLTNSQSGVNYTIYNGAAAVVTPVSGTGGTLSFGSLTAAATYTVSATNTSTGCTSEMAGSATVAIDPTPVAYSLSGGGSFCDGGAGMPLALSGTESGISYQLYNGITPVGSIFTGSGPSIMLGLFTAGGTYSVVATNTTTGCTRNMPGAPAITVKPSPAVYLVTGGGNYCASGTGMPVGLTNSATDVSYQLYRGTSPVGAAVTGTGAVLNFGSYTVAGTYSVRAMNTVNSCTSNMAGLASIAIIPTVTPSVSLSSSAGLTVCAGTMSTYTATPVNGGSLPSYQWSVNGAPLATGSSFGFVPVNGDIVKVKMVSSAVCPSVDSVTDTVTMTVNPNVLPSVSITVAPDSTACDSTTVNFSSTSTNGGSAPVYKWMVNGSVAGSGSSYSYLPVNGDNVVLSMTSNAPCRLVNTAYSNYITMTVTPVYNPSVSIAVSPGATIAPGVTDTFRAVTTGAGPAPAFKWFKNSVAIAGATNATYVTNVLANNDTISCKVTGSGLCSTSDQASVVVKVKANGVDEVFEVANITVHPNPNSGEFNINGSLDYNGEAVVSVANVLGQEVYRNTVRVNHGALNERVVLNNNLPGGTYMLTVHAGAETKVFRITLQR